MDINVLVVDDQRLVREGISSLLAIQEGINVVGVAENGQEAVEQALKLTPDIVLMDVRMPIMDGIEATIEIQKKLPACKMLMLTTFDDDEYILKSLSAGASGYLLKDIPAADLAQAVILTHKGVSQMATSVAGKLVDYLRQVPGAQPEQKPTTLPENPLTRREMDVLRHVAKGETNKEIAEALCVSEGTVKNHVSNILSSLGLRDRVQAALFAHEHKLV
jgi:DNA-binding NarL/FixJ family response regulator